MENMPYRPDLVRTSTAETPQASSSGATMPGRVEVTTSDWRAGLPVLSVPCGFVDGLPVGLALVGARHGEQTVLRAGHAFQRVTDWHERRPPEPG